MKRIIAAILTVFFLTAITTVPSDMSDSPNPNTESVVFNNKDTIGSITTQ